MENQEYFFLVRVKSEKEQDVVMFLEKNNHLLKFSIKEIISIKPQKTYKLQKYLMSWWEKENFLFAIRDILDSTDDLILEEEKKTITISDIFSNDAHEISYSVISKLQAAIHYGKSLWHFAEKNINQARKQLLKAG